MITVAAKHQQSQGTGENSPRRMAPNAAITQSGDEPHSHIMSTLAEGGSAVQTNLRGTYNSHQLNAVLVLLWPDKKASICGGAQAPWEICQNRFGSHNKRKFHLVCLSLLNQLPN